MAVAAVILFGLSKGGFSGLSTLGMPLMSLVVSPVRAAAIVLPILIVQDWVGVWAFRRDFSARNLIVLIPSAMIGVGLGWLMAARVSDDAVRLAIGLISIAFVLYMLVRERLGRAPVDKPGVPGGVLWGSLAGFTSFISHSGAPPFQVYVMPQYLEPRVFAGTATIFFAAVNLIRPIFSSASSAAPISSPPPGSFRSRSPRPSPESGWSSGCLLTSSTQLSWRSPSSLESS
jgi:uncharacterized protein